MAQAPTAPRQDPIALNFKARNLVLANAVEMKTNISSQVVNIATTPTINIVPRNVGLLKRFIITISGTFTNTAAANDATLTDFGLSNILSQVIFTDLNNNTRIQTSGRHLHLINTAKAQKSYGTAIQQDTAFATGVSWPVTTYSSPLVHAAGAKSFRMVYEVPLAYTDTDLRGSIYANVVNAVMNLQLTFNTSMVVANTVADTSKAVYSIATADVGNVAVSNLTVNVYQVYLDQLPVGQNGVILPIYDLSTIYELKQTQFSPLTAGNDFQIPYANFRDFLSTAILFNNDGGVGRKSDGTDVNYLALQSANFTNLWKIDPLTAAQFANDALGVSLPAGKYYFDSRLKPISTTQYGNMELIINPITASASSYCVVEFEDFALQNTLGGAASLPGGGL